MRQFLDAGLPEAPSLLTAPKGEPTPQERTRDELGSPLDFLSTCRYCWGQHPGACPYIQEIRWHPSGQIARVLLKERPDHESKVIYPGDEDHLAETIERALNAIAEAQTLKAARDIATSLLHLLAGEAVT